MTNLSRSLHLYVWPPLQSKGIISSKAVPGVDGVPESTSQLPRPDFSQMIPFKPKSNAYPGEHPLAGGTFPQPPALASLCARLPPPACFRGPFVVVDLMIDMFNKIQLPDTGPLPSGGENGCSTKLFDLAKSVHWIVDDSTMSGDSGLKRRRIIPGGDDSDDEGAGAAPPPAHDIYRLRQQKRFAKS